MNNRDYEKKYDEFFLHLYGSEINNEKNDYLVSKNKYPHTYSINEKIDLTYLEVYSVDPEKCTDADDAFSIFYKDEKLFLAIHIADPTEYIQLNSELWNDILEKNITKYPSNRKPFHLMPEKIIELSSLCENSAGNLKNAITVIFEIDEKTYEPINNPNLCFTTINVKKENSYSYTSASKLYQTNKDFYIGKMINEALQRRRSKLTVGTKLNELKNSIVIFEEDNCFLQRDNEDVKSLKQMIAEFAILTNSYIGEFFKIFLEGNSIFRTCNTNDWIYTIDYNISGNELINKIIENGITANYQSNFDSHDLVGSTEYSHFTSPIRRVSDCICHYLIKYVYLKANNAIEKPFSEIFLSEISEECASKFKKFKKIQYNDIKFRLVQAISDILRKNSNEEKNEKVKLTYRIISYSGLFVNILISKINEHYVHFSYTLRAKATQFIHYSKEIREIYISEVNITQKYDENTFPALDKVIFSIFLGKNK